MNIQDIEFDTQEGPSFIYVGSSESDDHSYDPYYQLGEIDGIEYTTVYTKQNCRDRTD